MPDPFQSVRAPLVSIVITNYNYARYLNDAVTSAFAQTYSEIECILVDDQSTDNSAEAIEAARIAHPALQVLYRDANGGHVAACLSGLAACSGQYVVFLDADDILLPHYVATHIATHLSLRVAIGFTCSDVAQSVNDRAVVATMQSFAEGWLTNNLQAAQLRVPDAALLTALAIDLPIIEADAVRMVPSTMTAWPWTATSSMMFRKDALDLVSDAHDLTTLRGGIDTYLAFSVNALCGSVLIDKPLSIYRLHGSNMFSTRASLNRQIGFERALNADYRVPVLNVFLAHIFSNLRRFFDSFHNRYELKAACQTCDAPSLAPGTPSWARDSRMAHELLLHFNEVADLFGLEEACNWLSGAHAPASVVAGARSGYERKKA